MLIEAGEVPTLHQDPFASDAMDALHPFAVPRCPLPMTELTSVVEETQSPAFEDAQRVVAGRRYEDAPQSTRVKLSGPFAPPSLLLQEGPVRAEEAQLAT